MLGMAFRSFRRELLSLSKVGLGRSAIATTAIISPFSLYLAPTGLPRFLFFAGETMILPSLVSKANCGATTSSRPVVGGIESATFALFPGWISITAAWRRIPLRWESLEATGREVELAEDPKGPLGIAANAGAEKPFTLKSELGPINGWGACGLFYLGRSRRLVKLISCLFNNFSWICLCLSDWALWIEKMGLLR